MNSQVSEPHKHTILVVDDTPENIDILSGLLSPHYKVRIATSGTKALEILDSAAAPDLVLLDAVMPGLSGFEVCRQIKNQARSCHIPVLFVTSLDRIEDEAQALSMGAADYITKPFSPSVVLARVRTHLALSDYAKQLKQTVRERTRALSDNEERLRLAVGAASLGIFEYDPRSRRIDIAPEHLELLGIAASRFDGASGDWLRFVHPDDLRAAHEIHEQVLSGTLQQFTHEFRFRSSGEEWCWICIKGRVVEQDAMGRPTHILGSLVDVTVRKNNEIRLQQAVRVFMHAAESISITDETGTFIEVNEAFTAMTGYSRDEVLGRHALTLLNAEVQSDEFFRRREQLIAESGHWTGEVWLKRKNGENFPALVTINATQHASGEPGNRIIFAVDQSEQKAHQRQLERVAHYDTLTSLPNRSLLTDRLQQAIAHARRQQVLLAVAVLDLDNFKAVNDHYGHHVGDRLLIELAQRFKSLLREGDTLARVGGDEFVAVLVGMDDEASCKSLVERLRLATSDVVRIDDLALQVTCSVGVTLFPQDDAEIDVLLRHADQAMYVAKQRAKNRVHFFDIAEDRAVRTHRESVEHIEQALRAREFALYYQPKVNMRTGQVIGAEALIRWLHPQRGVLSPATFLPVVEGHPLSIDLGEWVIDEALMQMTRWAAEGVVLPVSVNIGALQLQQRNFPVRLGELLKAHPAVEPGTLELEILETSALADITWASEVMRACQDLGVRFALDDFGTGYSSLSYLKRLPCEALKVDQSFVRDMLSDPDDLAIVQTVIGLAAAFRREVVAEGVETIAHGRALLELGCQIAQGYGIARPMPASSIGDWIRGWAPDASWLAA